MNDCPRGEIRDLLPELLHGRIEPAARAEVEQHVRGCADCRQELELLREMRAALAWATPAVRTDRIIASIPPRIATRRPNWANWRIAATVTLMALGGSSYALLAGGERGIRDTVAAVATSPAAPGLAMTGQLAELTEVELQAFLAEIEELEALTLMDPDPVALPAGTPIVAEGPA